MQLLPFCISDHAFAIRGLMKVNHAYWSFVSNWFVSQFYFCNDNIWLCETGCFSTVAVGSKWLQNLILCLTICSTLQSLELCSEEEKQPWWLGSPFHPPPKTETINMICYNHSVINKFGLDVMCQVSKKVSMVKCLFKLTHWWCIFPWQRHMHWGICICGGWPDRRGEASGFCVGRETLALSFSGTSLMLGCF